MRLCLPPLLPLLPMLLLVSCGVVRLVSGGPVVVGPPQPMELSRLPSVPPLGPEAASGDLQKAIQQRNQEIALLTGKLSELKVANGLDRKTMQQNQDARIRGILYWIAGVCLVVATLTGIAGFIPALQLFRGTLWGIAAGALATAALAYALAPVLAYVRYFIWACTLLGGVAGVLVLLRLYRTTLAAKLNAALADSLESIHPDNTQALDAVKEKFAALQEKFKVTGLTERLRKNIVINAIEDAAWEKAQAAKQALKI